MLNLSLHVPGNCMCLVVSAHTRVPASRKGDNSVYAFQSRALDRINPVATHIFFPEKCSYPLPLHIKNRYLQQDVILTCTSCLSGPMV